MLVATKCSLCKDPSLWKYISKLDIRSRLRVALDSIQLSCKGGKIWGVSFLQSVEPGIFGLSGLCHLKFSKTPA